ncbi:MAG: PD40 domain-containing protein [Anaerolineae bacterium]|nr:PD40 domain-containing protein [Anaerolineae bacterium]
MAKNVNLSLLLCLACFLMLTLPTLQPTQAQEIPPELPYQGNGRIAFVSDRDGNSEIYTMEADGGDVQRLTHNDSRDLYPAWSPDGMRIAFTSERENHIANIFIMDANGLNQTNLSNSPNTDDRYPAWSPDGTKIAFSRVTVPGSSDIYVMNNDGTQQTKLLDGNGTYKYMPTWSPDGTEIMFTSAEEPPQVGLVSVSIEKMNITTGLRTHIAWIDTYGHLDWSWKNNSIAYYNASTYLEINSMNVDGTNFSRITPIPEGGDTAYQNPNWSPDGTKIVFQGAVYNQGASDDNIYIVDVQSGDIINITSTFDSDDMMPDWQPISSLQPTQAQETPPELPYQSNGRIAFVSDRDGNDEIYSMKADGSDVRRLTDDASSDLYPDWSPDGSQIVFTSEREDHVANIFIMDADGSNQTNLTNDSSVKDRYPSWSPDGSRIVFSRVTTPGSSDIFVMNSDGSQQTKVVDGNGQRLYMPTWSPDGTQIMFTSADQPPQVGMSPR